MSKILILTVEDSTKPQLEPIEVQLADDLVKLSDGYQDPSQVIDGGVDPEASIDLRRGARPRTLTVREKAFKLEGVKKIFNLQVSTPLKHCIFVNGLLSEESLILPRLKQEQAKFKGLLGDLVDIFNELEVFWRARLIHNFKVNLKVHNIMHKTC